MRPTASLPQDDPDAGRLAEGSRIWSRHRNALLKTLAAEEATARGDCSADEIAALMIEQVGAEGWP